MDLVLHSIDLHNGVMQLFIPFAIQVKSYGTVVNKYAYIIITVFVIFISISRNYHKKRIAHYLVFNP